MDPQPLPSPALNSAGGGGSKTLQEQILLQPDFYIGSVEKLTQTLWIEEDWCMRQGEPGYTMTQREVTYVPGLLKIFDEILVFAADNKQRDPTMDTLRVDVDAAKCRISVFYSGQAIPIEVHRGEGVYVPEVIFGHLSDSDYNVKEEEITGGRSGYGVKLANVFSTEFVVETADGLTQKKYKQVFSENLGKKSEPKISSYRKGLNWSWTMVTFKPDLSKFNMNYLEDDVVTLMRKRVFDMAGVLGGTVQVVFNGQQIVLWDFRHYVYLFVKPVLGYLEGLPWLYEKVNDHCEVGMAVSEGRQFQQVSFVNKVATISGGTHVDYVSNFIVAQAMTDIEEKYHSLKNIREDDIKRHLMVFINLIMESPDFSSPTKEALTTPKEDFGSELELSFTFLEGASYLVLRKLKEFM